MYCEDLARLLRFLHERPTLAVHGKHQGTDALQFVTGEQPVDSAYSLQSIWEVGETGCPRRGRLSWESLRVPWPLVLYFQ